MLYYDPHTQTYKTGEEIYQGNEVPKVEKSNREKHKDLCDYLHDLYIAKNGDYGNSFSNAFDKYGELSLLIRLHDKFSRIEQLLLNKDKPMVKESVQDNLIDLANYSIMAVMELEKCTGTQR
jgi:hypothetical protein